MVLIDNTDLNVRSPVGLTHRFVRGRRSPSAGLLITTWLVAAGLGPLSGSAATAVGSNGGARELETQPIQVDPSVRVLAPTEESALAVNTPNQEYTAKPGERSCAFRFEVTNTSDREILINQVRTSCGCAVAQLPAQPWHLAAGASGTVVITVDLRTMSGVVVRTATIDLPTSLKLLTMKITVPATAQKSP